MGLGGCRQYNYHPHYSVPPFQYTDKQMAKRIQKLRYQLFKHKGFDILVTHAPAFGICDGNDACHTGFKAFLPLLEKYKPRYMFHGHMHLNFGKASRMVEFNGTKVIDANSYYILDIPE